MAKKTIPSLSRTTKMAIKSSSQPSRTSLPPPFLAPSPVPILPPLPSALLTVSIPPFPPRRILTPRPFLASRAGWTISLRTVLLPAPHQMSASKRNRPANRVTVTRWIPLASIETPLTPFLGFQQAATVLLPPPREDSPRCIILTRSELTRTRAWRTTTRATTPSVPPAWAPPPTPPVITVTAPVWATVSQQQPRPNRASNGFKFLLAKSLHHRRCIQNTAQSEIHTVVELHFFLCTVIWVTITVCLTTTVTVSDRY